MLSQKNVIIINPSESFFYICIVLFEKWKGKTLTYVSFIKLLHLVCMHKEQMFTIRLHYISGHYKRQHFIKHLYAAMVIKRFKKCMFKDLKLHTITLLQQSFFLNK